MKIKITLLFITFLVLMLAVTAQYSIKSDMTKISPNLKNISEDNVKVWVLFTDKGNLSKSQIDAFFKKNSDYISERSKERREKKSISEYSSYDLPLNKDYITVLENSGLQYPISRNGLME